MFENKPNKERKKSFSCYSTVFLCSHVTFLLIVSWVNAKEIGLQSSDNGLQIKKIDSDASGDKQSSDIEILTKSVIKKPFLRLIQELKETRVLNKPLYTDMLTLVSTTHPYSNTNLLYSRRSSPMSMFVIDQKIRREKLKYSLPLVTREAESSVDKSDTSSQINTQPKQSSYSKNNHNLTSLRNINSLYSRMIVSPDNRPPTLTMALSDHRNQSFGGHKHKRFVLINNHSGSFSNGTHSSWMTKMKPGILSLSWMNRGNPASQLNFNSTWMSRIRPISQNSNQFQPMIITNNHKGDNKYNHKTSCKHTEHPKEIISNTEDIVLNISNVNNKHPDSVTSKPVTVIDVEPNGTRINSKIIHKVLMVSVRSNQIGEGTNEKSNASSPQLQKDKVGTSDEDSDILDDFIQKPVTTEESENSVNSSPPTNVSMSITEMNTSTSFPSSSAFDLNILSTNTPNSTSSSNGPPTAEYTVSLTNMGTNSNEFLPDPNTSSASQDSNSLVHSGSEASLVSSSDIIQNTMNPVSNGFPLMSILRTISVGVILMLIPPGLAGLGMFFSGLFIS